MDDQELARVYTRAGFTLDTDRDEMEAFITQENQSNLTSGKRAIVDIWSEPNEIKDGITAATSANDVPTRNDISGLILDKHNSVLEGLRESRVFDLIDEAETPKDLPQPTTDTRGLIENKQREIADDFERELISRGILSGSKLDDELKALQTTSKGRMLAGGIKGRLKTIERIREEELK